jgi:hypothetical protein
LLLVVQPIALRILELTTTAQAERTGEMRFPVTVPSTPSMYTSSRSTMKS